MKILPRLAVDLNLQHGWRVRVCAPQCALLVWDLDSETVSGGLIITVLSTQWHPPPPLPKVGSQPGPQRGRQCMCVKHRLPTKLLQISRSFDNLLSDRDSWLHFSKTVSSYRLISVTSWPARVNSPAPSWACGLCAPHGWGRQGHHWACVHRLSPPGIRWPILCLF